MAEIEIGIMRHQCLRRRLPDEWTLRAELMAWEMHSNEARHKIHWGSPLMMLAVCSKSITPQN
jgi:hypothetical protein